MAKEYDYNKWMNELNQAGSDKKGKKLEKTICPTYFNKVCPLCTRAKKFLSNVDGREEFVEARSKLRSDGFMATKRYYMNVIVVSDPTTVRLFEAPPTIGEPLAKLQLGPNLDYVDFMHPTRGRNINIEKQGGGRRSKYKVIPRVAQTRLPDMAILKRMYDLEDLDQLLDDPNVEILRPSTGFQDDSITEIRVLPNWSFLKCMRDSEMRKMYEETGYSAFLRGIDWHYGISPDEFEMYCRGELPLPFEEVKKGKTVVFEKTGEDDIPFDLGQREDPVVGDSNDRGMFGEDTSPGQVSNPAAPGPSDAVAPTAPAPKGSAPKVKVELPCFAAWESDGFFCEDCEHLAACKEATLKKNAKM